MSNIVVSVDVSEYYDKEFTRPNVMVRSLCVRK